MSFLVCRVLRFVACTTNVVHTQIFYCSVKTATGNCTKEIKAAEIVKRMEMIFFVADKQWEALVSLSVCQFYQL